MLAFVHRRIVWALVWEKWLWVVVLPQEKSSVVGLMAGDGGVCPNQDVI